LIEILTTKGEGTMKILGLVLCLFGVGLGLYTGVWVCFIGGIVDVIEQVRADELDTVIVACGVAKVVFCGLAGWLSAIVPLTLGISLMQD
jgi:hypothetical protein